MRLITITYLILLQIVAFDYLPYLAIHLYTLRLITSTKVRILSQENGKNEADGPKVYWRQGSKEAACHQGRKEDCSIHRYVALL